MGDRKYEAKYEFYVTKPPASFDDIAKAGGWGPAGRGIFVEQITLSEDGKSFTSKIKYDQYDTAGKPAEGGAWAAWERIPFEPPFERRIHLLRIDLAGFPVNGQVLEVGYGTVAAPIAIAALGSRIALATIIDEPGSAAVGLRVVGETMADRTLLEIAAALERALQK